jgi:hypothetical protein
VLRVSRAFPIAAVALAIILAGCGGSHSTAPTTTTGPISTIPQKTLALVVDKFPSSLAGSITFRIKRAQGKPNKPGSSTRNYTVTLDNLVLRLAKVQGTGDKRTARYDLVRAHESFSGFETLTNSKCQTTRIDWAGSGAPPRGAVEIFSPKFDAEVGFSFLVPQRGTTTTRPCRSSSGGRHNTVTRTAEIQGNANLNLRATKTPAGRLSIGIEVQSSTAGPSQSGGYTINGTLAPPANSSTPVKLCRENGNQLDCNI